MYRRLRGWLKVRWSLAYGHDSEEILAPHRNMDCSGPCLVLLLDSHCSSSLESSLECHQKLYQAYSKSTHELWGLLGWWTRVQPRKIRHEFLFLHKQRANHTRVIWSGGKRTMAQSAQSWQRQRSNKEHLQTTDYKQEARNRWSTRKDLRCRW